MSKAAEREAWEEAGIKIRVDKDLGHIPDSRPQNAVTTKAPKASYQFFEVTVTKEEAKWPESEKRSRGWFTFAQASQHLRDRPELTEALKRSALKR